jgi:hypothetical protein
MYHHIVDTLAGASFRDGLDAQEAIEFQDWIDRKGYYHRTSNDKGWYEDDGNGVAKDTPELYLIFINQKEK